MDNYLKLTLEIQGIDENESIQPIQMPASYTCEDLKRDIVEEFKELRTGQQTLESLQNEYALWLQNGVRKLPDDLTIKDLMYDRELRLVFGRQSDAPHKDAYQTPIPAYVRKDLPEALQHVALRELDRNITHPLRYEAVIIGREIQISNSKWPQIGRIGIEVMAYNHLDEKYRRSLSSEHAIIFYYEDGTFYLAQVNTHPEAQSYLNEQRLQAPTLVEERSGSTFHYSIHPLQHGDKISLGHGRCYKFVFLRETL